MAGANPTDFSYQGLVNWAKNSLVNNVDARHIGGKEVALTTPQSGQALMYNGSKFVNADLAGAVYGKLNNTRINPAYLPSSGAKIEGKYVYGGNNTSAGGGTWQMVSWKISMPNQLPLVIAIAVGRIHGSHGRTYYNFPYPFSSFQAHRMGGMSSTISYKIFSWWHTSSNPSWIELAPTQAVAAGNYNDTWTQFIVIGQGA